MKNTFVGLDFSYPFMSARERKKNKYNCAGITFLESQRASAFRFDAIWQNYYTGKWQRTWICFSFKLGEAKMIDIARVEREGNIP